MNRGQTYACANADVLAGLLNEVLAKRDNWLPDLLQTEDAMRRWEANSPREFVLRLYKFLNQCGYTVIGIEAAIERESKKRKATVATDSSIKTIGPGTHRP